MCFTVVQLSLYELLFPELHLSIRVARHSHTHIHSTTALCMPESYIIQYCNHTAILINLKNRTDFRLLVPLNTISTYAHRNQICRVTISPIIGSLYSNLMVILSGC